MDRALKERIVGAIILVAAVVIVVPVFLDGPNNPDEIVSESISLPGQGPGAGSRTVVLNRDRTEPVPQPAAPEPEQQPVPVARVETPPPETDERGADDSDEPAAPVASEPASQPVETEPAAEPPSRQPAPTLRSSTGMWAVQLGSFSSQENADRLAADLRKQGFAAFLSDVTTANGRLHRVRIGPQKDRESAEAMAARLDKAGHKGQVVPHP